MRRECIREFGCPGRPQVLPGLWPGLDAGRFIGLDDNLWHKWPGILKRAGVPHITIHDLRRTYITRLAMAGVPMPVVQRLAGHRKIQTTNRFYTQVDDIDLRSAVERLPKPQTTAPTAATAG